MSKQATLIDSAPDEGVLREQLESAGHRYTPQRAAVYRTLDATDRHPSADEIFTAVRNRIPDISLATVYKALEAFVSCGLAAKLSYGDGPARYDSRMDAHDHLTCLSCGSVVDVETGGAGAWLKTVPIPAGFEVRDYRLVLLGFCPHCRS